MLFGPCNCLGDPSSFASMCSGGAGFITAMVGAMVAASRTGEARPVGRKVPEVLITAHCTGDRFYDLAREALGDKVIHSAVGTRFVFSS